MIIKEEPEDFVVEEITNRNFIDDGKLLAYKATKRNLTTVEMLKRLANANKLAQSNLGYAGLKDRRAVTAQYITAPKELKPVKDVTLELVGHTNEPLRLGDLEANKFSILIKEVMAVRDNAVPNYFGDQRFSHGNLESGLYLVKKDYEHAVAKLSEQYPAIKEALTRRVSPLEALKKVPFPVLLLYAHSVQSFLWNEVVSAWVKDLYAEADSAIYTHGELLFPKTLPDLNVPLVGPTEELGLWEDYYDVLLSKLGITKNDFYNRSYPQLTLEGGNRKLRADIRQKSIKKQDSKVLLKLTLGPGSYATTCIKAWFS